MPILSVMVIVPVPADKLTGLRKVSTEPAYRDIRINIDPVGVRDREVSQRSRAAHGVDKIYVASSRVQCQIRWAIHLTIQYDVPASAHQSSCIMCALKQDVAIRVIAASLVLSALFNVMVPPPPDPAVGVEISPAVSY